VESLNWTGDYFARWILKMATENIKYIVPKQAAVEDFVSYTDKIHKTLVWSGSCTSWYKRGTRDGRVTALFGGSAVLFHKMIHEIRGEDFDVVYRGANRFEYMGNGFTEWELRPDSDLAWYVEVAGGKVEERG
jgi:hypothetical protein